MLAHVVLAPGVPVWADWLVAAIEVGVFGVLVFANRRTRRIAIGVGGGTLGALVLVTFLLRTSPPAPVLTLSLADPAAVTTTPVLVHVCASDPSAVFAGGRVIELTVDGRQQAVLTSLASLVVPLLSGHHEMSAELVTAEHVALTPRVLVQRDIVVSGSAPPATPRRCP